MERRRTFALSAGLRDGGHPPDAWCQGEPPAPPCARPNTSEHLLLVALLEEAVRTYQRRSKDLTPAGRELYAEARAWFDGADGPFPFADVCDHLRIDRAWFLRCLRAGDARHVVRSVRVGQNANLRVCSKALVGLHGPRPTTAWGPRAGARIAVR